jgi:hypothetical protein
METLTLDSAAVIVTARSRPGYLRETLASWQAARGLDRLHSFTFALGYDPDAWMAQCRVIDEFRHASGLGGRVRLKVDSDAARRSNGMHRAIAEAANHVLADPAVEFVIFGEEDIAVSADVLEYMDWARQEFAVQGAVAAVCAHSRGGAGWDPREPAADADADQETVRLVQYFNPWCWGTWRNRWEKLLEPTWDYDVTSGGPMDSGYDHNIHRRVLPEGGLVCAVPDASRSQNIGRHGGWASNEETWAFSQAASFRAAREPVTYRLEDARDEAA